MDTADRARILSRKFGPQAAAAILDVDMIDMADFNADPADVPVPPAGGAPATTHVAEFVQADGAGPWTINHGLGTETVIVSHAFYDGTRWGTFLTQYDVVDENTITVADEFSSNGPGEISRYAVVAAAA